MRRATAKATETGATPGPWRKIIAGNPAPVFSCGCTAARELRCWRGELQERWTLTECGTHAAAPAMREALVALTALVEDYEDGMTAKGRQPLDAARAALAQARGEVKS